MIIIIEFGKNIYYYETFYNIYYDEEFNIIDFFKL
jgi:hypothetical protein